MQEEPNLSVFEIFKKAGYPCPSVMDEKLFQLYLDMDPKD